MMSSIARVAFVCLALFAFRPPAEAAPDAKKLPELPLYPNQPYINASLKNLDAAKAELAKSTTDYSAAIIYLQKAEISLKGAVKDKGSFRLTAIRVNSQAIKDLEKKNLPKALHNIDEAIEACHKAGKMGER